MTGYKNEQSIERAYTLAREQYAALGVDTEAAMQALRGVSISLHCWQGDDVGGFENTGESLSGGIAATGNYPGKARTAGELRQDLDQAYALIPGSHRLNLHASYAETGSARVDRDALRLEHFQAWVDWAKAGGHGLDFNPTLFSHPKAAAGFTLTSPDPSVRAFWIEHCIRCREIGAAFGEALGSASIANIWIPDGFKDTPVDRYAPRQRLKDALDTIFARAFDPAALRDAVEGKLFGLGAESYTAGSHEFYLGYTAAANANPRSAPLLLCLDAGHFHPTETISDKLSSVLLFVPEVLLHVSRGVRWDSDHVVTYNDDLQAITQEIVRGDALDRVHIGLDFFDASINRVAAWVTGTRSTLRGLLSALLEPLDELKSAELAGDYTKRLAMLEELKHYPAGAVWDMYCLRQGVPAGFGWLDTVKEYESAVLAKRM
jgi:L-rhamnose isomerase